MKYSKKWDPVIEVEWTDDTFNSVDWQANKSSFNALSLGKKIQISKYAHEWTPTLHQQAHIDDKIDRWCFACRNLKENVTHMLQCPSTRRQAAQTKTLYDFKNHLARYHTPAPMATLIIEIMTENIPQ
jgi:hypothetical protein